MTTTTKFVPYQDFNVNQTVYDFTTDTYVKVINNFGDSKMGLHGTIDTEKGIKPIFKTNEKGEYTGYNLLKLVGA